MAKKSKKANVGAIETAAVITEASEAVMRMAMELVDPALSAENSFGELDTTPMTIEQILDPEFVAALEGDPIDTESTEASILAEAVEQVEALEAAQASETVSEVQATDEPTKDVTVSFDDMIAGINDQERLGATVAMSKAIDERAAFELANGNDNIQKTLKKAREQLSLPSTGAVLLACGVDESFVNRSVHDGKRYNVYAFGKLADVTKALSGGTITNKINYAVMRSLFNARKAGVAFTGETAKMAASDKIRCSDAAIKAILIRHTVSASTAPTQASSTMQALETLGLVKREGSHKNPTFTLTDHPAVAKLEAAFAAAA